MGRNGTKRLVIAIGGCTKWKNQEPNNKIAGHINKYIYIYINTFCELHNEFDQNRTFMVHGAWTPNACSFLRCQKCSKVVFKGLVLSYPHGCTIDSKGHGWKNHRSCWFQSKKAVLMDVHSHRSFWESSRVCVDPSHKLIFAGCIYIFSAGWQNFWPIYSPNNASRGSSVKTDLGSTEDPKHLGLPKNSERAIRNLIPTIFHMFTTLGLYKIHGWHD